MTTAEEHRTRAPGVARFCSAELDAIREDAREADFVCSTEAIDSYGEVVKATWLLDRFEKNPVALFAHDSRSLPIGYWKNVTVKSKQLIATVKVATAAANPLAEQVWNSILQKTLRAVSVGFWPHKISFEEIDGVERCVLDENELFEISVVPIPANPEALALMAKRSAEARTAFEANRTRVAVPYEATEPVDTGAWHAGNAIKRIRKWASSDGSGDPSTIDWHKYSRAFAYVSKPG